MKTNFLAGSTFIPASGQVWAAPWAQLAHIGTHMFDGILTPTPTPVAPPVNTPIAPTATPV